MSATALADTGGLTIGKLGDNLGAEARGVDLSQPLDDAIRDALLERVRDAGYDTDDRGASVSDD